MIKKICMKCKIEKDINEFYKDKTRKDGHYSYCKECAKRNVTNLYKVNKEKKINYQKEYYQLHKQEKRQYDIIYKEKTKQKRNATENEHYANDILYKLKKKTRNCILKSFKRKGYKKNGHTYNLIGCDYNIFFNHLLKTYKENYGVNWNGKEKVHIDHIIPICTARSENDLIKLCHYTNLQLLKVKDNLQKSNKLNYKIQS